MLVWVTDQVSKQRLCIWAWEIIITTSGLRGGQFLPAFSQLGSGFSQWGLNIPGLLSLLGPGYLYILVLWGQCWGLQQIPQSIFPDSNWIFISPQADIRKQPWNGTLPQGFLWDSIWSFRSGSSWISFDMVHLFGSFSGVGEGGVWKGTLVYLVIPWKTNTGFRVQPSTQFVFCSHPHLGDRLLVLFSFSTNKLVMEGVQYIIPACRGKQG